MKNQVKGIESAKKEINSWPIWKKQAIASVFGMVWDEENRKFKKENEDNINIS